MSITKRHYNNGYYIAHTKGKQSVNTSKEEVVLAKTKKSLYVIHNETKTISGYSQGNIAADNNVIVASNENRNKTEVHLKAKQSLHQKTAIAVTPVMQVKSVLSDRKKVSADVSADERDGLSLFWIVILVILILWAVGFLAGGFGLGGFINLLLLVALILLILWLIRII